MIIKIDKHIPIPKSSRGGRSGPRHALWTDTFRSMDFGDSFLVTDYNEANTARQGGERCGYKVVIRKTLDRKFRVWKAEKND